jgi:hypothetical protein
MAVDARLVGRTGSGDAAARSVRGLPEPIEFLRVNPKLLQDLVE